MPRRTRGHPLRDNLFLLRLWFTVLLRAIYFIVSLVVAFLAHVHRC